MNNKVTIITGVRESGKTRTAKLMAEGRKSLMFDGKQFPRSSAHVSFYFGRCTEDTDVIILDDCKFNSNLIERVVFGMLDGFKAERQGKDPIYVNPEIVIVINSEEKDKANKNLDDMLSVSIAAQRRINLVKL